MEHVHKVMLLGDIGVGKTSLVRRLIFEKFEHDYKATIGVDVYTNSMTLDAGRRDKVTVRQLIWDIDGDFGESIFKQIYIKGATAALIIGDCSRQATLNSVLSLGQAFLDEFPGRPLSLIVNKTDLVSAEETARLMNPLRVLHAPILLTSAKTGENVREAFESVAQAAYERGL
jgi:Ras-related protein Rab-22